MIWTQMYRNQLRHADTKIHKLCRGSSIFSADPEHWTFRNSNFAFLIRRAKGAKPSTGDTAEGHTLRKALDGLTLEGPQGHDTWHNTRRGSAFAVLQPRF